MYRNYGDVNFFELGILVDTDHTYDPEGGQNIVQIIRCLPYDDEEDVFCFGELTVDIDDPWIDRRAVLSFIGMTEETFDPIQYAIGCTDYYSWDNFGAELYDADWQRVDREYIKGFLKYRSIDPDGIHVEW